MEKIINKNIKIKSLSLDDIGSVDRLYNECEDYFLMVNGATHTEKDSKEILTSIPPNKELKDKFALGIFYKEELIGVIDLVKDYPVNYQWIIGLFLLKAKERRKGIGKLVHGSLVEIVLKSKGRSLRIGVVKSNINGLNFWKNLGYKKIKESDVMLENQLHKVDVMVLELH